MLILAAGVVVVIALVVVFATKGGSTAKHGLTNASTPTGITTTTTTSSKKKSSSHQTKPAKPATPPAELSVVVLNGTETTGLAHRISTELQQAGYSQANALFSRPPGTNEVTVVEYASGHQADAQEVAHSLSVSRVQPMEQAVTVLAGSAKVVVIAGADRATTGTSTP